LKDNTNETASLTAEAHLFRTKLYVDEIKKQDIDIAHRLGSYKPESDRGIICKFIRRTDKSHIMRQRYLLKRDRCCDKKRPDTR